MRAIAFLCLLHAVFHETHGTPSPYSWNGFRQVPGDSTGDQDVCVADKAGCGCCLMKTHMKRMKEYFNLKVEGLSKYLNKSKTAIQKMTENYIAFSVALNNDKSMTCHGPFEGISSVPYKHVFLNWGNDYNVNTNMFTASRSGIYSIAATIYSTNSTGQTENACAALQVNDVMTTLRDHASGDPEDSSTAVIVVRLEAGDTVTVNLLQGCIICDNEKHYSTFTGFLLYPTD
ncbi:unnamed protein product [Ophioblennius macclurei]